MITKLASKVVYRNPWMTVREDEVRLADGSSGIYGVVEKPDFAVIVPFDGNGFYLVEQDRYPVLGRYVEFPQGSWETDPDTDLLEVALGELAEETGLRARSLTEIGRLYGAYGYSTQGFGVFLATELDPGEQRLSAAEAGLTVVYLSASEIDAAIRSGGIKDSATVAAWSLFRLSVDSRSVGSAR